MKDLDVRQESIKILEENIDSNPFDLSCSNFFLDTSPKAREARAKIELLGLHQGSVLLHSKANGRQNQMTTDTMGEVICP